MEDADDAAARRRRGVGRPALPETVRLQLRDLLAADPTAGVLRGRAAGGRAQQFEERRPSRLFLRVGPEPDQQAAPAQRVTPMCTTELQVTEQHCCKLPNTNLQVAEPGCCILPNETLAIYRTSQVSFGGKGSLIA